MLVQDLAAHGVRVPEDCSVVAYDDVVAALGSTPLTAVSPPKGEVGRAAAELLLHRLRDPHGSGAGPARRIELLPELKVRGSTRALTSSMSPPDPSERLTALFSSDRSLDRFPCADQDSRSSNGPPRQRLVHRSSRPPRSNRPRMTVSSPGPGFRPRAALAMSQDAATAVLDPASLTALAAVCDLAPLPVLDDFGTDRAREILADVDLLVTGWGCPVLDADALAAAPRLRAVVHTAGSVRPHVTDACWERGIEVSSAAAANALPVAEYTLAMILLTGKQVLERAHAYATTRARDNWLHTSRDDRQLPPDRGHRLRLPDRPPRHRTAAPPRPRHPPVRPVRHRRRRGRTRRGTRRPGRPVRPLRHGQPAHPAAAHHPGPGEPRPARLHAPRRRVHQHRPGRRRRPGRPHRRRPGAPHPRRARRHRPRSPAARPPVVGPAPTHSSPPTSPVPRATSGAAWPTSPSPRRNTGHPARASAIPYDAKGWPSSHEQHDPYQQQGHPLRTPARGPRVEPAHRLHPGPLGGRGGRAAGCRVALEHPRRRPARPARRPVVLGCALRRARGLRPYLPRRRLPCRGRGRRRPARLARPVRPGPHGGHPHPGPRRTPSPGRSSSTTTCRASRWSSRPPWPSASG